MNPFALFIEHVREIVTALAAERGVSGTLDLSRIAIEPPREAEHGDLAINAAMVFAKEFKAKPRELADGIASRLSALPDVARVNIAGPGFINLTLDAGVWRSVLRSVIEADAEFGRIDLGRGERVNVEYVSANPTGPMHVGHGRGAVFGDALANLLGFTGFAVTREYYVNDAGAQVDLLARSAYLRYREALGETIGAIPDGLYPGDYLIPVGQSLARLHGSRLRERPEPEWLPVVRAAVIEMMMAMIREDLAALAISHDVFFSERSLSSGHDRVAETIELLQRRGEIYQGRLPPPKGAAIEDWEDREQILFRSTKFGDDVDRPLKKSDGSYTYFAADIAYHRDKIERGFTTLIDVWGADHGGYIKRMQAAVAALGAGMVTLDVKLCQLVRLLRAGEPVKMSKRAGEFVTLREVVDEVGPDAVRFMMLFRKNDAPLDFDLVKVVEQSRENPVFYVQYAHARARSVLRNVADSLPSLDLSAAGLRAAPLDKLTDEGELRLIKHMAQWPRLVEAAARAHEPHRIAFFLHDLASGFHAHWTRGNDLPHLRFIIRDDPALVLARAALVSGLATVLASGLAILGVRAPEEMR